MGKNYEAYQKAQQADKLAAMRLTDVNGGSSQGQIQEAQANKDQAMAAVNDTWNSLMENPEG